MFTPEEVNLVYYFATERSDARRLWFYLSVLVAPVVIAGYGLVQRDYLALAVGFVGLLGMVVWAIANERRYASHFRSICEKLASSGIVAPKEKA
jgi:hypothetical protein